MNRLTDNAIAQPLAVVLVTSILAYDALADYPAASLPGQAFNNGVLNALLAQGINSSVISLRPVSSYPRAPQLFYRGVDGALREGVPSRQIGFINAGPLKVLTAAFTSFVALLRWARQHQGKRRVMLFYNTYNPSGWIGIIAARLTRSKMITIVADVRVPGSGGGEASLLRRMEYHIAIASLRRMDAIVPVTKRISEDFAPGVPSLLLNGGITNDILAPLPTPALPIFPNGETAVRASDNNSFVVVYAGSLSYLAGVPLLLQAFKRIEHSHFQLWITGAGEFEPVVRKAAAMDPRIRYLGILSRPDLLATYAAADVLVNPHSTILLTARYVFPSKLLEYLATGRPVITTATPDIAVDYRDLCTVLDREEPQELADAIMQVAATPAPDRLARATAARVAVIARFAWSRQGQRLVQFLKEQSVFDAGGL